MNRRSSMFGGVIPDNPTNLRSVDFAKGRVHNLQTVHAWLRTQ